MIEDEIFSSLNVQALDLERFPRFGAGRTPAMTRLSMSEMTTYRWSLIDDVAAYREAGIEAIAVWRPKLVEFSEERGIDLLRESGLAVSSLAWAGGFTGSNGHSFAEALDDGRDAIRTAARLGAESLVIISGSRSGHTGNHSRRLLIDGLKVLGDAAAEHNVTLALLPMHRMFSREWTFLTSIDAALDVLDRCDHPHVKMAFNVYHLWQEPRLLERIPDVVPSIALVQLNDWRDPPRSENDRCQLGDGEIPLTSIVRALVNGGYEGFFEIEIWSEELWGADYIELLRDSMTRFDELCRW